MRTHGKLAIAAAAILWLGSGLQAQNEKKELEKKRGAELVSGKTLYEWTADIKDKDPSVRERAIAALKFYGRDARQAVPEVIKALKDRDVSVRVNAVITLGFIGMDEKDVESGVNGLSFLLSDSQGIVRYQAIRTLGRLGSDAAPAIPRLTQALQDASTWEIRNSAAWALGTVGWSKQEGMNPLAWKSLLRSVNDPCLEVRFESLMSLILLGTPAQPADVQIEEQTLAPLTNSKQPEQIQIWARVCLMRIGKVSEAHLAGIGKMLKSTKPNTRIHAARALSIIGIDAKSQVENLIDCLDDSDPNVIIWTCVALGQMKSAARSATSKLKSLKDHKEEVVRRAAADALAMVESRV